MPRCVKCKRDFEKRDNEKFCSQECRNAYLIDMDKRIQQAVKNDPSHTKNLTQE